MKQKLFIVLTIVIILSLGLTVLSDCNAGASESADKFEFELPEGFAVSDVVDKSCTIINSDGVAVGGFARTDLEMKDLKKFDGSKLPQYLYAVHEGSEYFSWDGESSWHLTKHVRQFVSVSDSAEPEEYYRVFFERESCIYDMWFNTDLIDEDTIAEFVSVVAER